MLGRILRRVLVLSVLCMAAFLLYRQFGPKPVPESNIIYLDPSIGAPAAPSP